MKVVERVSEFIGKWMAVIIVAVAAFSLWQPFVFGWIKTGWVNYLLGIAMFGMGLTLVSTTAVVMIVAAVVSANAERILSSAWLILAVVVLHKLLGYGTIYPGQYWRTFFACKKQKTASGAILKKRTLKTAKTLVNKGECKI